MFTVLFTVSVFLLAGLLVDGGLAISARERASDIAEQAARAGANDINEDLLRRTGQVRINARTACGKAHDLLNAYGVANKDRECTASASPPPGQVTVTVTITVQLKLLSIVPGFSAFTMTGTASAHPDEGNP
jgi:Flp pilus assembly protein TadG